MDLIKSIKSLPTQQVLYWEELLQCNIPDWSKYFLILRKCCRDTYLINFQYKFLHRVIPTNTFLYKIHILVTRMYSFYIRHSILATKTHLFYIRHLILVARMYPFHIRHHVLAAKMDLLTLHNFLYSRKS